MRLAKPVAYPPLQLDGVARSSPLARYVYVNDLRQSKKLSRLTRHEVVELLGRPDHENSERDFRYALKEQQCGLDRFHLDIEFDPSGRVVEVSVRPD